MDPTSKKHPKSSFPDPSSARHKQQFLTSLRHNNPPPRVDARLQAKAMTVSLIAADSPNPLNINPNPNSKRPPPASNMDQSKEKSLMKSSVKKEKESSKDVKKVLTVAKEKESQQRHDIIFMGRPSVSLGRRRSFCSSQIELAGFLAKTGVKVVSVDMPPFMQIHAVDCARNAYDSLEKFTSKTLAFTLKKEFDGVYGPAWHCIVGTSFGSFVTHSVGGFMYFAMDHKLYILLFKTTVQRAD